MVRCRCSALNGLLAFITCREFATWRELYLRLLSLCSHVLHKGNVHNFVIFPVAREWGSSRLHGSGEVISFTCRNEIWAVFTGDHSDFGNRAGPSIVCILALPQTCEAGELRHNVEKTLWLSSTTVDKTIFLFVRLLAEK